MSRVRKNGITVPELLGVFALVGVLCAAIVPQLLELRQATKLSKLRFNLESLRTRIDTYRQRHGRPPSKLEDIASESEPIYENPMSLAPEHLRNRVKVIAVDPPTDGHLTPYNSGGWLYNPDTGGVWADSAGFLSE